MFKSAATKIAHNTTIPALAGNSDLRPLQDLITAEKAVLMSLQKLRLDIAKAGDALRIWGQGEGDDLGDILTASSTILTHFAAALTTYSSLHHTIRDSMKSVRTREEALDELRRRRRRVDASAETAQKKLNKMSPEHKNLGLQTDTLNKLRDEMRALDAEIVHQEAGLGDYKRKCTKDWMGFKFGGLVECCEKGVIVGEFGRQIIQSIPEDVTQPGFPRAQYDAHGRVGNLVVEAQHATSRVTFSAIPSGRTPASISQPPPPTSQDPPVQSPFLPTPSLGSELTLGVGTYNPPPGPPPANRRVSVDELGAHTPRVHATPQFSSLANKERDPIPASSVGSAQPLSLSVPHDSGVARTEENQSLMASIADALSQSHRGFSLEEATSLEHPAIDDPVPKYEPISGAVGGSAWSEPHAPVTNGHVTSPPPTQEPEGQWHRRTTRRSTSPPSLPPGAAPAAIRAWDDRMGQGEDGAHSDHPASSSARMPSQRLTSSSERDGEEEDLAYDHDSLSLEEEEGDSGDGKHHNEDTSFSESGREASVDAVTTIYDEQGTTLNQESEAVSNADDARSLLRAGSQWRISRVPPPPVDVDTTDIYHPSLHEGQSLYSTGTGIQIEEEVRTDESTDERAHSAAAAREVSRAMDELAWNAVAPPSSGYTTARGPPSSTQSQTAAPYPRGSPPLPPSALGRAPYASVPSSPIIPSNSPFGNRGPRPLSGESIPDRLPTPTPTPLPVPFSGAGALTPRSTSPMYRSPPPEYPRPTPPFSSPLMARSTSSLSGAGGGGSPGGAPRTISAAAFRRQQARTPSDSGPADTSPLTLRKPSGSPSPSLSASRQSQARSGSPTGGGTKAKLSVVNPDPRISDEEEAKGDFDYIAAYGVENTGYGAGRYVSDLERDG